MNKYIQIWISKFNIDISPNLVVGKEAPQLIYKTDYPKSQFWIHLWKHEYAKWPVLQEQLEI